jgi:hypothetical protein
MSPVQPASKKLMPYVEVRKIFSEGRRVQLSKQGPMTVAMVRGLQATMKHKR